MEQTKQKRWAVKYCRRICPLECIAPVAESVRTSVPDRASAGVETPYASTRDLLRLPRLPRVPHWRTV